MSESNFHKIAVQLPPRTGERYDMFIGRFRNDGLYHVLGYRPSEFANLFPAERECNQDLGAVKLPKRKTNLSELEKGEVFLVTPPQKNKKTSRPWKVRYLGHNSAISK